MIYVIYSCIGLILCGLGWYYRYRFVSFCRNETTNDMGFFDLEGYTDKSSYIAGETLNLYLYSNFKDTQYSIRSIIENQEITISDDVTIGIQEQIHSDNQSVEGCNWQLTKKIDLPKDIVQGYYQIVLSSDQGKKTFSIPFIVSSNTKAKIIILAPVSTWNAYNPWGGKSLYQNKYENKTVYKVSTLRPNTAFQLNHSIKTEANITDWFTKNYDAVAVYPDYYLESRPELFAQCALVVLAYHCEYVSRSMYDQLQNIISRGASMISLGANQLYWVTQWNNDYTQMECRKDLTMFDNSFKYGGLWKHHFRKQETLCGARYTGSGMHTFAPYAVTDAEHWLFNNTNVKNGDLFGINGVSGRPISGAETDKHSSASGNIEIIAHGLNCDNESQGAIYNSDKSIWNGEGGADLLLKPLPNGNAVLSTGSIESGAGLGYDEVFTTIVKNFIERYAS